MAKPKGQSTSIAKQEKGVALAPMEPWEMELAQQAKDEVAKEATGMPRVTHKSGVLRIDGKEVTDNKLKCVIVDYVFSKAYYEEEYDPEMTQTPVCYAFGREEKGMAPHANAPKKQHEICTGCPHNVFGTAEKGRGKRCKDERRLGIVVEVNDPASIQQAEVRAISVPPGSLKNWSAYLRKIPEITPTGNVRALLTEISARPAENAYVLTFKPIDKLAKTMVQQIVHRREAVSTMLVQPYPAIESKPKALRREVKGQ